MELAQWIEASVPESIPLLVDNIPGRYLERRAHSRQLHSWMDLEVGIPDSGADEHRVPDGSESDFALWLEQSEVGYVFWTLELWTEAPRVAPFLRPCDWADEQNTGVCADIEEGTSESRSASGSDARVLEIGEEETVGGGVEDVVEGGHEALAQDDLRASCEVLGVGGQPRLRRQQKHKRVSWW